MAPILDKEAIRLLCLLFLNIAMLSSCVAGFCCFVFSLYHAEWPHAAAYFVITFVSWAWFKRIPTE